MYRGGEDSLSGSGLGSFAARAARICLSLSSNCIFDFLSSKNANRVCAASRLAQARAQIIRWRPYLLLLSFYHSFLLGPGFRQSLLPLSFALFELLEDRVADQKVVPV